MLNVDRPICLTILALSLPLSGVQAADKDARPNILFIFTDDQSHRSVSCYEEAHPWVKTPNIDRLAREGLRFVNAYAGTWCAPSRAMVLTGLQPHAMRGLKFEKNPISRYDPNEFRFWPAELRKSGYRTAFMGKWHLSPDAGHGRDWDHSVVWNHSLPGNDGKAYYLDPKLSIDGMPQKTVMGYSTDIYTDYAEQFLRRKHDKPWFLWLCPGAAHAPYLPAERHAKNYPDNPVPTPADIYPPRLDKPTYMHDYGVWTKGPGGMPVHNKKTLPEAVRQYNRVVQGIDESVGRLLKTLKETGQLDSTFIVFTADQGFAWGQHGFEWKVAPYDANLRVPFILRHPGRIAQGKVCRTPVCTLDLIPTFHALAEKPTPWAMHGHDLQPLLKAPEAVWPYPVMLEHFRWSFGEETDRALTRGDAFNGVPWWLSLRQGRYKYIRTLVEDEIEELYDLDADPEELHNLAIDAKHHELLAEYRRRLVDELMRTKAGLVKNLPAPKIVARPMKPENQR